MVPYSSLIPFNCLNSRIRSKGLSAYEMWSQRNQFNKNQIDISDKELIALQHKEREANHVPSAKALEKAKTKSRYCNWRHCIPSIDKGFCMLRKFTDSKFRCPTYSVRLEECYLVPSEFNPVTMSNLNRYWPALDQWIPRVNFGKKVSLLNQLINSCYTGK